MSDNLNRWNKAKITRSSQVAAQAKKLLANRSRYDVVAEATGVPWDVIAVIHVRESSGSFAGVLHNGQKIIGTGKKTTLVPKGRGPFSTWEEAAIDALMKCAPYLGKNSDWSLGNTLELLEKYNGLGYRKKGLPSPYLWAGTDQYTKGKYVADGKFDANAVDKQLGVAALLMALRDDAVAVKPSTPTNIYDGKYHKQVEEVQTLLDAKGYPEVGDTDGKWGSKTRAAVLAFKADNGLNTDWKIDEEFLAALAVAGMRPVAEKRAEATVAELRKEEGGTEIRQTDQTKILGYATATGGVLTAATKATEAAEQYSDLANRAMAILAPIQSFIVDNLWIILLGVGGFVVYKSDILQRIRLEKHQTGKDVSV